MARPLVDPFKGKRVSSHRGGPICDATFFVISALRKLGWPCRAIGKKLKLSASAVSYAVQHGLPSARLRTRKEPTNAVRLRRRKVTRELRLQQRKKQFPSAASISVALTAAGTAVSRETVRRDLKAAGFHVRVRPRCPREMQGDNGKRRDFAKTELKLPRAALERTIFTDEKIFNNNDHSNRFEWLLPGQIPTRRRVARWGPTVHVYGAIGVGFRRLILLPKGLKLNSQSFKTRCLQPLLRDWDSTRRLQQDGAPCHRAAPTMKYLHGKKTKMVVGWPPRSPQLSPIENLWALVQRKVSDRIIALGGEVDSDELGKIVAEEFNAIPQEIIDSLVRSYPQRLRDACR